MSWDTGDKCDNADDCSWADKHIAPTIWITPEVQAVIRKLCDAVITEWQMLLTGVENKEGVWVTGYWIPKQEVTASTVKNLDCIDADVISAKGIVCTIHSHATMGVFFSCVDDKFTNNSLIKNHIVVNNKGLMKACMRYELPCKMTRFFDAEARVIAPIIGDVEGFDNITKKVYPAYDKEKYNKGWKASEDNKKGKNKWDTDGRKMKSSNKRNKRHHAIGLRGRKNEHGVMIYDD